MQAAVYCSTFLHEFARKLTLEEPRADVPQGAPPHVIKGSSTYYDKHS